jgi:hypothetical protein
MEQAQKSMAEAQAFSNSAVPPNDRNPGVPAKPMLLCGWKHRLVGEPTQNNPKRESLGYVSSIVGKGGLSVRPICRFRLAVMREEY